ncbi:MAG: hypothetical protein GWM98_07795, partial [Nitrospinaceae bacterium]|nr:hypothetical protein [Nitrospinaceae bacterium]NIR54421.1 hypothetical protein [Nitrospinaceae bacterium]NIS84835.1 hypothetical protein [Nitrospinaceae bacterium]NIT81640.1 hypothetical protein [Nitrospinaceae bacterium]NIU43923.1 hypothetical protein [Nitrospinaceae bacterium]
MDAESNQATLEEKDFLALLEVIRHLHACRTRQELRAYIRDHLLPFFNAQAAGWGWLDYDFSSRTCRKPQMLDGVGIPEGE